MSGATPRVGLLHTVPGLAATFHSLVEQAVPGARVEHVVDPSLLQTAIDTGVTPEVHERIGAHIRHLVDTGAEAVLVTCSSIGEAVESEAAKAGVPVLRVDTSMARRAVELATEAGAAAGRPGRIAVLATLAATLGPTGRLLEREAAGADVDVATTLVEGAVAARESGDQATHDALIRDAVAAADADVIVLAQASMATAAADADTTTPVLTSPEGAVAALAALLD